MTEQIHRGEVLAIVPARGGSKSIPNKNIAMLYGQPLIAYTIKEAKLSVELNRVILSTNDEEIAKVARQYDMEVPFMRPDDLAKDSTPTLPVIQDVLQRLSESESYQPDHIVILQPTSPLRLAHHIDEAVRLLKDSEADSVVSVIEVPHQFHPNSLLNIVNGRLEPFIPQEDLVLRRQDKPKIYARNGAAIYAMTYETIMEMGSLFGRDCRPYLMDEAASVDIDTSADLEYAEFLMASKGQS